MSNSWIDEGFYWRHTAEQGTKEWKQARVGRCTGTSNNGKSSFGESEDNIADCICGIKKKLFTPEQRHRMDLGTLNEPNGRKFYEKKYNKNVIEIGLCVPKFNLNIGASVDGILEDENGIIEIKCPQKMYYTLKKKSNREIYFSHFKQMQFNMAVTNTNFCDYVVYGLDGQVYVQRVRFDPEYWKELYCQTVVFWNKKVKPRLESNQIKVLMPPTKIISENLKF